MLVRLHVVIDKEDEDIEKRVKDKLSFLCAKFSYSPSREQPSLNGCLEWYATADTKMFDENVYYLQFQTI